MPCNGGGPSQSYQEQELLKAKIDRLTQDLCFLCASLLGAGILEDHASERTLEWHKEHMEKDEKRLREKMREVWKSGSNCTPEKAGEYFFNEAKKVHPVSQWHDEWFQRLAKEEYAKVVEEKREAIAQAELAKQARAKLSPEELEALGF